MSESPKVWSRFSAKNKDGVVINLRIEDLQDDRYEDFIELFMNYFIKEESTFRASGISKSPEALAEVRAAVLKRRYDESFHTVICCLDNKDDDVQNIIGASIMNLAPPEEIGKKGKTKELNKLLEVYGGMQSTYDLLKEFKLDRYLIDRGLFVHPDYRGLGIAQELFKVRRMICKEYGVPLHGAWMTSYGTQKAAERDGWETVCEIHYDEYGKKHGVTFENGPPTCKFMVARISL